MNGNDTTLIIEGGRLIDPSNQLDGIGTLILKDGIVQEMVLNQPTTKVTTGDSPVPPPNQTIRRIDATGMWVLPGFIDIHTHLRDPGYPDKEDLFSGLKSAAAGGMTSLVCMANTKPTLDNPQIIQTLMEKAHDLHLSNLFCVSGVTKDLHSSQLVPMKEMRDAGAVAFSNDGLPIPDPDVMEQALIQARELGTSIWLHEEDPVLRKNGVMHEGAVSRRLGLPGNPSASETSIIERDIQLAVKTGGALHIQHVSAKESLDSIQRAKDKGIPITVEVTPHHLLLTCDWVESRGTYAKMAPPLREEADRLALVDALAQGIIDIIATDHAPHTIKEKQLPFAEAPFGVVGMEGAISLTYQLVREGLLPLSRWIDAWTAQPARLIQKPLGRIAVGSQADLVIFDPQKPYSIDASQFFSKGRNTPFQGFQGTGSLVYSIVQGKIIFAA